MNNLEALIRYILLNYPKLEELSKPRLVKLIYLIDWRYTIEQKKQFTNIKWYYNHYGPYVGEIIDYMKSKPEVFNVKSYINTYQGTTDKFELVDKTVIKFDDNIKNICDKFIDYTSRLNWSEFINLVYSSYPIIKNSKYSNLDLPKLAEEFRQINHI